VGIQPYPPGPIEKRIRKVGDMIRALLDKIPKGPPIDPADFPLGPREGKEHKGSCWDAHGKEGKTHEQWKEEEKKSEN